MASVLWPMAVAHGRFIKILLWKELPQFFELWLLIANKCIFTDRTEMQGSWPPSRSWTSYRCPISTPNAVHSTHSVVYDMASFQRVHNRIGERFQFVPRKYSKRREKPVDLSGIAALCVPCATYRIETKPLPDLYLAKLVYHKSHIPPRKRSVKFF